MSGNRKSTRMKGYDYTQNGLYYVTVCVDKNICRGGSRTALNNNIFGDIKNNKMILNATGQIINDSWQWLEKQYQYIKLDEYVIMSDHLHGIICINNVKTGNIFNMYDYSWVDDQGASRSTPTYKRKTLGGLIGAFKTISTKRINTICNTSGARLWQRNYYDHIIRNRKSLNKIRNYIKTNHSIW